MAMSGLSNEPFSSVLHISLFRYKYIINKFMIEAVLCILFQVRSLLSHIVEIAKGEQVETQSIHNE